MTQAKNLVKLYGGARERSRDIVSVGFAEKSTGNVASAFDIDGAVIFNFAWRPHKPSPESNLYTAEGLFFC